MFTVSSATSLIELKVYDWNRVLSNVLLGTAKLQLGADFENRFQDLWLPLDKQGELHVMFHVSPFPVSPAVFSEHMSVSLPALRIQLESSAYYPGQIVRGAFVYSVTKPIKIRSLCVQFDGRASTSWVDASGSHTHHCANYIFFNQTAAMLGTLDDTAKDAPNISLEPGSFVFPFEYVLPMDIPPSINDTCVWANMNRYQVTGHVDVVDSNGSCNRKSDVYIFTVLPRPSHSKETRSVSSTTDGIVMTVTGPEQMWAGEEYTFRCKIENGGKKDITDLKMVLIGADRYHAKALSGKGAWATRGFAAGIENRISDEWHHPLGVPVAAGSTWEGDVSFKVPSWRSPSLTASVSPLVQTLYALKVKIASPASSGKVKYPVLVADRKIWKVMPNIPVEPMGPLGKLISAPAPPEIYASLVPTLTLNGKSPVYAGRAFPAVASYKGAMEPLQEAFDIDAPKWASKRDMVLPKDSWTPGTVPSWVKEDASIV